jgi:hypothetical protein
MQLYRIYDKVTDRHLTTHYGATYWNSLSAVKAIINDAKRRRREHEERCKREFKDPDEQPEGQRYWWRHPDPYRDWEVQVCDFLISERLDPKWVATTVHKKKK